MKEWLILDKSVTCFYVTNCFSFGFMFEMGRELCSKLWKMIFFNIFTWLGSFPYVFGTVKEWLTLELHEMITVTHVLAFPLDFNLLCD